MAWESAFLIFLLFDASSASLRSTLWIANPLPSYFLWPSAFMSGFLSNSCVISSKSDHLAVSWTYPACFSLWLLHLSFPFSRMFFPFLYPHMCVVYLILFSKSLPNSYLPGRSSLTTPLILQSYFTYLPSFSALSFLTVLSTWDTSTCY